MLVVFYFEIATKLLFHLALHQLEPLFAQLLLLFGDLKNMKKRDNWRFAVLVACPTHVCIRLIEVFEDRLREHSIKPKYESGNFFVRRLINCERLFEAAVRLNVAERRDYCRLE